MKPRVAIAGFGKSGKSSLFNAIYGEKVARVSMRTDETVEAETLERFGIDFTDTPGIGTGRFSLDEVVKSGALDRQHVVVHLLNGTSAITADDEGLHEVLGRSEARRIIAVNKIDLLDPAELAEYQESLRDRLKLSDADYLLISAKHGTGIDRLVSRIAELLPEAMRDAFIAQQQGDVRLKERRVRALIYSQAAISAAIGAVPIPVADIALLSPLQIAMVTAIGAFHGVQVTKERAMELVGTLGAGVGLREAARQLVKLVPGWGSMISGSIAFAGTVALGETANLWFKRNMKVDDEELRKSFTEQAAEAKVAFDRHRAAVSRLERKIGDLRQKLEKGELTPEEFEAAMRAAEEAISGD